MIDTYPLLGAAGAQLEWETGVYTAHSGLWRCVCDVCWEEGRWRGIQRGGRGEGERKAHLQRLWFLLHKASSDCHGLWDDRQAQQAAWVADWMVIIRLRHLAMPCLGKGLGDRTVTPGALAPGHSKLFPPMREWLSPPRPVLPCTAVPRRWLPGSGTVSANPREQPAGARPDTF